MTKEPTLDLIDDLILELEDLLERIKRRRAEQQREGNDAAE